MPDVFIHHLVDLCLNTTLHFCFGLALDSGHILNLKGLAVMRYQQ